MLKDESTGTYDVTEIVTANSSLGSMSFVKLVMEIWMSSSITRIRHPPLLLNRVKLRQGTKSDIVLYLMDTIAEKERNSPDAEVVVQDGPAIVKYVESWSNQNIPEVCTGCLSAIYKYKTRESSEGW